jgi:hypothetical protein
VVSLVLFAAVIYYAIHLVPVYWRYYQLKAEMESQARLAPSLTDAVIRRRLVARADDLLLPPDAQRFKIRRSGRPRRIEIETEYSEPVQLPLLPSPLVFHPFVQEPL